MKLTIKIRNSRISPHYSGTIEDDDNRRSDCNFDKLAEKIRKQHDAERVDIYERLEDCQGEFLASADKKYKQSKPAQGRFTEGWPPGTDETG